MCVALRALGSDEEAWPAAKSENERTTTPTKGQATHPLSIKSWFGSWLSRLDGHLLEACGFMSVFLLWRWMKRALEKSVPKFCSPQHNQENKKRSTSGGTETTRVVH